MSKRVRTESKRIPPPLRLSELRLGTELFEVLPFSSDVVFLVAEYSQYPRLPPDLHTELLYKTRVLRDEIDNEETCTTDGAVYYKAEVKAWLFAGCYTGTYRGNEDDWPEWALRNCEQYNDIDFYRDNRVHCPKWIRDLVSFDKMERAVGEFVQKMRQQFTEAKASA